MIYEKGTCMPGIIQMNDMRQSQALIGNNDEHLKAIEEFRCCHPCTGDKELPLKVQNRKHRKSGISY